MFGFDPNYTGENCTSSTKLKATEIDWCSTKLNQGIYSTTSFYNLFLVTGIERKFMSNVQTKYVRKRI